MVTKYSDASKKSKDLLSKDYQFDKKFKLTSLTKNGVKFTTDGTLKPKLASGGFSASFTPIKGVKVDKLAVTTDGRFKGEASLLDAVKGAKFTVKAEDGAGKAPAGKLCVEYARENVAVDASLDVVDGPTRYGAAT